MFSRHCKPNKNSQRCKYFISPFQISKAYFPSFMQTCIKCSDELKRPLMALVFVFHLFLIMNDLKLRQITAGVCCSVTVTKHKPTFKKAGSLFLTRLVINDSKIDLSFNYCCSYKAACAAAAVHVVVITQHDIQEKKISLQRVRLEVFCFKTCSENHSNWCLKTQTNTNHAHSTVDIYGPSVPEDLKAQMLSLNDWIALL